MYAALLQHLMTAPELQPAAALTGGPVSGPTFLQLLMAEQARSPEAFSGGGGAPLAEVEAGMLSETAAAETGGESTQEAVVAAAETPCCAPPLALFPRPDEAGPEAGQLPFSPLAQAGHEPRDRGDTLATGEEGATSDDAGPADSPAVSPVPATPLAKVAAAPAPEPAIQQGNANNAAGPAPPPATGSQPARTGVEGGLRGDNLMPVPAAEVSEVTHENGAPPASRYAQADSGTPGSDAEVPDTFTGMPPGLSRGSAAHAALLRAPWLMRHTAASRQPAAVGVQPEPSVSNAPVQFPGVQPLRTGGTGPADSESSAAPSARPSPDAVPLVQPAETEADTDLNWGRGPQPAEAETKLVRKAVFRMRAGPVRVELHGAHLRATDGESHSPPAQPAAALRAAEEAAPRATAEHSPPTAPSEPRATLQSLGDYAVRGVRYLAGSSERTLTVRMSPASLGEVRLEVQSNGDGLSVRIASANPAVRHALEAQMPALREAFAREGIDVVRVEVSPNLSANTGSAGSHHAAGREPGSPGHGMHQPPASGGQRYTDAPAERDPQTRKSATHRGTVDLYV